MGRIYVYHKASAPNAGWFPYRFEKLSDEKAMVYLLEK